MQTNNTKTLGFFDVIPRVGNLMPRIPSIVKNLKAALSIKPNDHVSLGSVLELNAERYKDNLAFLYEDHKFTHHTFNEKINQYANYFISIGIKKDDVVVVFMENRMEIVFMIAAMAKIGGIASLINPNQRLNPLKHSIQVHQGATFVIGEELVTAFEEIKPELDLQADSKFYWVKDKVEAICPKGYKNLNALIESVSKENPFTTQKIEAGQHYANVFTSGTTGLPRASIQRHKRWLTTYYWFGKVNMNLNKNDVMYVPIPFYHTNALIVAWPSAAAGGAAIAMRRKFSTSNFWNDVQKFKVTAFIYIGEVCRYLYNAPLSKLEKQHNIEKIIGNGLRPDIWMGFKNRFKIPKIFELYGSAESNISFTNTLNIDCCVGWSPNKYALVKYDVESQTPIKNDIGYFEKVKKGEVGLLIVQINDKVPFDGYVNKARNEEKMFSNVFEEGDQWFNAGDLLRDLGYRHAQFVDRVGDSFRWKGENVATDEVEKIVNNIEEVEACAVYGVNIPNTDGRAGMLAITTTESNFKMENLANELVSGLPSYAVPIFVRICKEIETTATHKIKKFPLQQESFNCTDQVFVMLPSTKNYVLLTDKILAEIDRGVYAF
ncbi:long-chain-acyl-CoA synthetase [Chondrinema litorale]|uniref:long-chain-acyl-CoA synthetase n=1 Tax=Chondrinema litorale TaxID=2994555 RepID=UPI002542C131|nr:long-chain-acyl-CoA synthetase [Chondrinema litorale]UZR96483.1 long-chain-acyl-CoA synthetase [Chondrinema litorale]